MRDQYRECGTVTISLKDSVAAVVVTITLG
jgi:hypothetical protein